MEDLWAFNEEELVRAIFSCSTPIISSIGHETDTTIADFVSDLRAPTPSAAAVSATPDRQVIIYQLSKLINQLKGFIEQSIEKERLSLNLLQLRIIDPSQQLQINAQKLDEYELRLFRVINLLIEQSQSKLKQLVIELNSNSKNLIKNHLDDLSNKANLLNLLSPLNTLSRGYSISHNEKGGVIVSIKKINKGDIIVSQFNDGKVTSKVTNKEDN